MDLPAASDSRTPVGVVLAIFPPRPRPDALGADAICPTCHPRTRQIERPSLPAAGELLAAPVASRESLGYDYCRAPARPYCDPCAGKPYFRAKVDRGHLPCSRLE